ncbi:hypothetical protein [Streptomyces sp. NPDC060194]|uniref:hypothetical protein n=1 Tax=Streptomyces sp. NPDC060194 TaxID=3347069 RepID=UPI00366325DD
MTLLRSLVATARMIRHTARLAEGLPADEEMLLDAPDRRLAPALVAAGRGEHGGAAELLAATRERAAWEDRDRYAVRLAAFALRRHDWLTAWRALAPGDPDVALLAAELAVHRALSSPARVELLRAAGPLVAAAAEANPGDPVPWRVALDHARSARAPRRRFDAVWAEAGRRASHHYGCHVAALRYLAAAGHGAAACLDFAERAAGDALPGSLIQALPARAALAGLLPGAPAAGSRVPAARLHRAADRAIALSAARPPADPRLAEVRNLLTYLLVALERWPEALTQIRLLGTGVTSFPWDAVSDDPLGQFLELRDGVRIQIATRTPLRARAD